MKLKGKAKAAFLRRMAAGRNHAQQRKAHHHSGGHNVAKKRRHHSAPHHHKSKGKAKRRASGGMGRWLPDQQRLVGLGTAFAYGKVEAAAAKDPAHLLNKVPGIVAQIGKAGNLGAILWAAGVLTRHPMVKAAASGVLHVAAYQNGRKTGGFSKESQEFSLSGPGRHAPGRGRDELMVERYLRSQRGEGG